jgi:hypothetical protein
MSEQVHARQPDPSLYSLASRMANSIAGVLVRVRRWSDPYLATTVLPHEITEAR